MREEEQTDLQGRQTQGRFPMPTFEQSHQQLYRPTQAGCGSSVQTAEIDSIFKFSQSLEHCINGGLCEFSYRAWTPSFDWRSLPPFGRGAFVFVITVLTSSFTGLVIIL